MSLASLDCINYTTDRSAMLSLPININSTTWLLQSVTVCIQTRQINKKVTFVPILQSVQHLISLLLNWLIGLLHVLLAHSYTDIKRSYCILIKHSCTNIERSMVFKLNFQSQASVVDGSAWQCYISYCFFYREIRFFIRRHGKFSEIGNPNLVGVPI